MKFFMMPLIFISSFAYAQVHPCVREDIECVRHKDESDEVFCARILAAKKAGNPGYKFAYCNVNSLYTRYVPKEERELTKKPAPISLNATSMGRYISPGVEALEAEISMGRPFAEAASSAMKLGYMSTRKTFQGVGVDLDQKLEGVVNVPKDESAAWVAYDVINHSITAAGFLGHDITKSGRAEIIQGQIAQGRGGARVGVQGPSMTMKSAPEDLSKEVQVLPKEIYKNYKFTAEKSNSPSEVQKINEINEIKKEKTLANIEKEHWDLVQDLPNKEKELLDILESRVERNEVERFLSELSSNGENQLYDSVTSRLNRKTLYRETFRQILNQIEDLYQKYPELVEGLFKKRSFRSEFNVNSNILVKSIERGFDGIWDSSLKSWGEVLIPGNIYYQIFDKGQYEGFVSITPVKYSQNGKEVISGSVNMSACYGIGLTKKTQVLQKIESQLPRDWDGLVVKDTNKFLIDQGVVYHLGKSISKVSGLNPKVEKKILSQTSRDGEYGESKEARKLVFKADQKTLKDYVINLWQQDIYYEKGIIEVWGDQINQMNHGDGKFLNILHELLKHPDSEIRLRAIVRIKHYYEVKKIAEDRLAPELINITKTDPDRDIRGVAANRLSQMEQQTPETIEAIALNVQNYDDYYFTITKRIEGSEKLKIDVLKKLVASENKAVRDQATYALFKLMQEKNLMANSSEAHMLVDLIKKSQVDSFRENSIKKILHEIEHNSVLMEEVSLKFLADENPLVRLDVLKALRNHPRNVKISSALLAEIVKIFESDSSKPARVEAGYILDSINDQTRFVNVIQNRSTSEQVRPAIEELRKLNSVHGNSPSIVESKIVDDIIESVKKFPELNETLFNFLNHTNYRLNTEQKSSFYTILTKSKPAERLLGLDCYMLSEGISKEIREKVIKAYVSRSDPSLKRSLAPVINEAVLKKVIVNSATFILVTRGEGMLEMVRLISIYGEGKEHEIKILTNVWGQKTPGGQEVLKNKAYQAAVTLEQKMRGDISSPIQFLLEQLSSRIPAEQKEAIEYLTYGEFKGPEITEEIIKKLADKETEFEAAKYLSYNLPETTEIQWESIKQNLSAAPTHVHTEMIDYILYKKDVYARGYIKSYLKELNLSGLKPEEIEAVIKREIIEAYTEVFENGDIKNSSTLRSAVKDAERFEDLESSSGAGQEALDRKIKKDGADRRRRAAVNKRIKRMRSSREK